MDIPKSDVLKCHVIRDGHSDIHRMAYFLEYIIFHMPEPKRSPALEWLIRNDLRGQKFLDFIKGDCKSSGLELIRLLTMRVEKERTPRKLYAADIA